MYPPHLTYLKGKENIWFNPSNGIVGFWNEFKKVKERFPDKPFDYVWNHRDLKRAKEIYITSIVAKGISILEKQGGKWWIVKPKNDPPDGVIGTEIKKNNGLEMHVREIEIVEYLNGDIIETIKKKLSSKQYEPNTILVCFLSIGGDNDLEKLSDIFSKETSNLANIFIAFHGMRFKDIPKTQDKKELALSLFKISLVQIKPKYNFIAIDPIKDTELWRTNKEKNFLIFEQLGKGGLREITLENPPKLF
jgi:hypothetical protein